MRTVGIESRAKGFLVYENLKKKTLLRDGGAMEYKWNVLFAT